MKEFSEIEMILRTQRAIEKELRNNIISSIPEVAVGLVSDLFDLIDKEGKELRLALTPCIVLNYIDSKIYLRLLPIEAGALINSEYTRKNLFPSIALEDVFKVKSYELYDVQLRKQICEELANNIKAYLTTEIKCKCKVEHCNDGLGYNTELVEYKITPKI